MNDFVTVLTVRYSHQLLMIKGFLEAEGIEYFVKDELTIQSDPLWSNALGGIKLQVQKEDRDRAIAILKEFGYLKDESFVGEDLLIRVDRKTSSIPFLKDLKVINRIITITVLSVALITTIAYLIIKPSKRNLLTRGAWTADNIYFKGKLIGPKTIEIVNLPGRGRFDFSQFGEMLSFDENGVLMFPGLHCRTIQGTWKLEGGTIMLHADTLMNIINGSYNLEINEDQLTLTSATTVITAHFGL